MSRRIRLGLLIAVLGIIVVIGGLIAISQVVRRSLAPLPPPTPQPQLLQRVVVTTHDIALGEVLRSEDLRTIEVPLELVPTGAMSEIDQAVGKFSKVPMVTGELVLGHHLADPTNVSDDIGFQLSDAQVLMAFPSDDLMSTLNVIQRGDLVDILVSVDQEIVVISPGATAAGGEEQTETRTITFDAMQRVSVTAMVVEVINQDQQRSTTLPTIEGETQPQPTPRPTNVRVKAYLLALLPQDALVLKHFKDIGATFDIVLRAPTSSQLFDLLPVTSDYLIDRYELDVP